MKSSGFFQVLLILCGSLMVITAPMLANGLYEVGAEWWPWDDTFVAISTSFLAVGMIFGGPFLIAYSVWTIEDRKT
jgi:hypothetical protein